jgi:hypothetical protein
LLVAIRAVLVAYWTFLLLCNVVPWYRRHERLKRIRDGMFLP